jgi:ribosomal protein S8
MNTVYINCVVSLRNASMARKMFVDVNLSGFVVSVLDKLYESGFIIGYHRVTLYRVRVFLKYAEGRGLLDNLHVFGSLVKKMYVTHKKLLYLFKKSNVVNDSFILLSTSKGLFFFDEYCQRNINHGGLLLLRIKV